MKRKKNIFNKKNSYSFSQKQKVNIKVKNNKKTKKKYHKNITIKHDLKKVFLKIILFILFLYTSKIPRKIVSNNNNKSVDVIISNKKRIGVINLYNMQNVGNILVKFSLFKKLKEFDLNPVIIAQNDNKINISFINRTVNLKIIENNFSELNESDYDYFIVNSDQTWAYFNKKYFYDIAFLRFAENWTIPKFIYAASIGNDRWFYTRQEEKIASRYLRNFTGISFREKGLVKLAKDHLALNVEPVFVLDPTLLIDKSYYLNEIKNYKRDFNFNEKYIFVYQLDKNKILEKTINESIAKYNYKIYKHNLDNDDYIESFIFGINISQAVITDSFHGTVFSIMFNKPFISFINRMRGKGRFDSLKEVINLENRIIDPLRILNPDINLLLEPLNINQTLLNELRTFSVNYLKKNLGIIN